MNTLMTPPTKISSEFFGEVVGSVASSKTPKEPCSLKQSETLAKVLGFLEKEAQELVSLTQGIHISYLPLQKGEFPSWPILSLNPTQIFQGNLQRVAYCDTWEGLEIFEGEEKKGWPLATFAKSLISFLGKEVYHLVAPNEGLCILYTPFQKEGLIQIQMYLISLSEDGEVLQEKENSRWGL